MKLTKADIDKVRNIEGFPIARDEDIIALSRPPYYTACPNPFIEEFIREHGKPYDEATDDYHREPFAADVSEGKNDPIYMAHSYHTKVPYKAIMRYILHYTNPGDIIFDGFSGTGMTGVAAQSCTAQSSHDLFQLNGKAGDDSRYTVLVDLSPAATFISSHYNLAYSAVDFQEIAKQALNITEQKCSWMYETRHVDTEGKPILDMNGKPVTGRVNYWVLSDVFVCPSCSHDIVFWDAAVDATLGKVKNDFECPNCKAKLSKRDCEKSQITYYDDLIGETATVSKQVPVVINYTVGSKRYKKKPDAFDAELEQRIDGIHIDSWVPVEPMLGKGDKWGDTWRAGSHLGITHVHQFYTRRNLITLSVFYEQVKGTPAEI